MARKIVDVIEFVEHVNRGLAAEDESLPFPVKDFASYRLGLIAAVEHLLFATNQYKGFRYLPSEFAPHSAVLRPMHDDTRRQYYTTKEN